MWPVNNMSLDNISLPFLKITELPDKFKVCVGGNSEEETQYTKEGRPQRVLHVILIGEDGQAPIKNSPTDHWLSLSNHALQKFRKMGVGHLDDLRGKIISFKKAEAQGFTVMTIEPMKIEVW